MADTEKKNFLDFSKIGYNELITQVSNKLSQDPRFENFRESSIAQMIIEIFSGMTDLVSYQLERRSEEQFMDTAKLKSSIILLAKQLGYIIQRPIPAEGEISITLKGPLPAGISQGDTIEFPKYTTTFTHGGFNYILKNTMSYEFTSDDITNGTSSTFSKTLQYAYNDANTFVLSSSIPTSAAEPVKIIQGDIKTVTFQGSINGQVGKKFQKYTIQDDTFSNIFGENDLGYSTSADSHSFDDNITLVKVGPSGSERNFTIDRRSLLNIDSLNNFTSAVDVCVVKTLPNEYVEIIFGDDQYASKGPETVNDNIVVRYLSTQGTLANQIGVIGEKIQINQNIVTSSLVTIPPANIEFGLTSNVRGGADLEDIDSIKLNAPNIYYSLDRLVSKRDYQTYLKTLTSPINVHNSVAWGEQEFGQGLYVQKLFNIVLYSIASSLYYINDAGTSTVKTENASSSEKDLDSAFLEGSYEPISGRNSYFNLLVKNHPSASLKDVENLSNNNNIKIVSNYLKVRGQVTTSNIYLTPIVQFFNLAGTVTLKSFSDRISIQRKVNNKIYKYLNDNADFNSNLYISNIIELIEEEPSVRNADVYFQPVDDFNELNGFTYNAALGTIEDDDVTDAGADVSIDETEAEIKSKIISGITAFTAIYGDNTTLDAFNNILYSNYWVYGKNIFRKEGITERTFYNDLIQGIYNNFENSSNGSFVNSTYFLNVLNKMHNDFSYIIRQNMLDGSGNIVNFSIPSEIPQISLSSLIYSYA